MDPLYFMWINLNDYLIKYIFNPRLDTIWVQTIVSMDHTGTMCDFDISYTKMYFFLASNNVQTMFFFYNKGMF